MPSAAPPSAPSTRPSRTSNAIFMMWFLYVDVRKASQLVATAAARFNVGMKIKFDIEMLFHGASFALCAPERPGNLSPHRAAHAGGERVGQVLAQQLLHKIERIEKRAVYQDASAA